MVDDSKVDKTVEDLKRYASYISGKSTPVYGKDLFIRMATEARDGIYSEGLERAVDNYHGPAREQLLHDKSLLPTVAACVIARAWEEEDRGEAPLTA